MGGSLSLKSAWSTERVPGQPELHRETLSQTKQANKKDGNFKKSWNVLYCAININLPSWGQIRKEMF